MILSSTECDCRSALIYNIYDLLFNSLYCSMIYLEVLLSLDSLMKLEFLIDYICIVIGKLGILPKPI